MKKISDFPWHPLFFAAYPVLALLAGNFNSVNLGVGIRPLIVLLAGALILLAFLRLIFRDWRRAALIASVLILIFFTYGQVYSLVKGISISGFFLFRHRTLIVVFIAVAGLSIWWATRKKANISKATVIFNMIGLVLVILPMVGLTRSAIQQKEAASHLQLENSATSISVSDQSSPDVYYIILDGYGRSDILKEAYNFDNSSFINGLREMGFYVADCSQSNYAQTELSFSASLNYDYLSALGDDFVAPNDDRSAFLELIKHNRTRTFLESAGYRTIAFATGFSWTEWGDADIYFAPKPGRLELNEFEYMLVETSAGRILQDTITLGSKLSASGRYRQRTLLALEKLRDIPAMQGPKFTFVHIVAPHPPFVFGPDGEPTNFGDKTTEGSYTKEEYIKGYVDQATYIGGQILNIVEGIIRDSPTPPLIIIQGDHGPGQASRYERMGILNAYYLPGVEAPLYDTITPVNTFRVILNAYFGQNLPLLEDASFFSRYQTPYDFSEISNDCQK